MTPGRTVHQPMTQAGGAWAALCAVVVAAWVAIALGGADASPVTTTAAGAAAAAATAALLGAGWRATSLGTLQTGGVLVLVLPAAAAGAVGGSTALFALVLVVLAGVEAAVASTARLLTGPAPDRRDRRRARVRALVDSLGLVAGCGLLATGVVVERIDGGEWALPAGNRVALGLLLAGAAVLVGAAAVGPPRAWAIAVPALAVALPVAERLSAGPAAVVAGGLAVAAAIALPSRPTIALAALAVAAASSSAPLGAAAPLLGAAAVLALAVDHRGAALLGLPGAAALAAALVPPGRSDPALAVAAAAAGVALALALRAATATPDRNGPARPSPAALPALVLAGWLLLVPGTWAWAGGDGTGAYDRGAAVAAATTTLALVAAAARPARRQPAATPPAADVEGPVPRANGPGGPVVVLVPPRRQGRLRPARQRPESPVDG